MNTQQRDPIFESLDRLAGIADADLVGDRMPNIKRRVRTTRRRRGIAVAAAVLAVGGVGLWQGLPSEQSTAPITNPRGTPSQRITVDAQPQGHDHVRISFTVTGKSTAYADLESGEPVDYAGPRSTEVLVDGKVVDGSDGGAISCRPGGALTSYSLTFHVAKPLVVPVSSAGPHTVVVKAPYCADGVLTQSVESALVTTTEASGFMTFDQRTADLDGDGTNEVVKVLVPKDAQGPAQLLRVTWGTGETTTARLPNAMETTVSDPVDLDGDGDLELIVQGGGGDVSIGTVFLADTRGLEQVRTVDAAGHDVSLTSSTDPADPQTYFGTDGILSYRLDDPAATHFPAPVEVRAWSLTGSTLTESDQSVSQCVTFQRAFSLGPC